MIYITQKEKDGTIYILPTTPDLLARGHTPVHFIGLIRSNSKDQIWYWNPSKNRSSKRSPKLDPIPEIRDQITDIVRYFEGDTIRQYKFAGLPTVVEELNRAREEIIR